MKHTPGQWRVTHQINTDYSFDIVTNGKCLATCGAVQDKNSEIAANAHLIAAAPELLEACKAVLEDSFTMPAWVDKKLKQAIAKAEGVI